MYIFSNILIELLLFILRILTIFVWFSFSLLFFFNFFLINKLTILWVLLFFTRFLIISIFCGFFYNQLFGYFFFLRFVFAIINICWIASYLMKPILNNRLSLYFWLSSICRLTKLSRIIYSLSESFIMLVKVFQLFVFII